MGTFLFSVLVAISFVASQAQIKDFNEVDSKSDVSVSRSETDLRKSIFNNYDKSARPVKKASDIVPVSMTITPLAVLSMDELTQVIVMDTWIQMKWKDEYLSWKSQDYGVSDLSVPPTNIWRPDIALYTATPDTSLFPKEFTNTIVSSNGEVLWVPQFTISSRCPFTYQKKTSQPQFIECNIQMGSWTYGSDKIDLQLLSNEVDLSNFQNSNRNWKMVRATISDDKKKYPCCQEDYVVVNFNVTLKSLNSPHKRFGYIDKFE